MTNRARLLERLARASAAGSDLVTLWRDVTPILGEAVPHFEAPCFFTVDPSSLLTTSHFQEGLPEIPAEWLGREYAEGDFNSMRDVLASVNGVGTLHTATGGRPELSTKYHVEMQPFGCEQELVFALRTRDGQSWGAIGLYRERGTALFDEQELDFVREAGPLLAEGARFGLRFGQAGEPDLPDAPGLILLDPTLRVASATPTAGYWLKELGASLDALPTVVTSVAGQARAEAVGPAAARVLAESGRWLAVYGAKVEETDQVSVIVESAQPTHLAPLLMQAFGLTEREQDVTFCVLRGSSTAEAAKALSISQGTVQRHLTSIFDKTGVRSRGELLGLVFQTHYEPRVRDNEHRTGTSRPSRDGPMPSATYQSRF